MRLVTEIQQEVDLRLLQESIPRIIQCLNTVDETQIWHKPNNHSNSMGNLVLHLCGNVRQYFVSSIGGKEDNRNRDLEFNVSGLARQELLRSLDILSNEIRDSIKSITEEELMRTRSVQGFNMTGIRVVIHVIEHFSYHTGQIAYMTKLMKDLDLKFYGDLDLNVTGE